MPKEEAMSQSLMKFLGACAEIYLEALLASFSSVTFLDYSAKLAWHHDLFSN